MGENSWNARGKRDIAGAVVWRSRVVGRVRVMFLVTCGSSLVVRFVSACMSSLFSDDGFRDGGSGFYRLQVAFENIVENARYCNY